MFVLTAAAWHRLLPGGKPEFSHNHESMQKIKAILFDLDGTLIDSAADLANSVNHTMARLGLRLYTENEIRCFVGDGVGQLIKRALGPAHLEEFDRAYVIFMDHYGLHCTDNTVLYPGVAETLPQLADNFPLAVVTNKSREFSNKILTALDIASYFKEVLGGDSLPTKKPDPAGIFYLANKWGLAPARMLMVGDHATDIEAGRRAGCPTVFIEGGIGTRKGLQPDFVIESMRELPELLNNI